MNATRGLMIVGAVVVVGSGAGLLLNRHDREKDAQWEMWAGLHNVALAQFAYYADNDKYFGAVPDFVKLQPRGAVITVDGASDTSWTAHATHPQSAKTCRWSYAHARGVDKYKIEKGAPSAKIVSDYSCS